MAAYAARLGRGGFEEALTRAMLYVVSAEPSFDERCAAPGMAFRDSHLPIEQFKALESATSSSFANRT